HFSGQYFIKMIGAVEQTSNHPVAQAIFNYANEKKVELPTAQKIENMPGYGIRAIVAGTEVIIASSIYYEKNKVLHSSEVYKLKRKLKQEGKTVMIVYIDQRYAGMIAVSDEIKSPSIQAISRLKHMGKRIILLTGDHEQAGLTIADAVGITEVYIQCTPEDKAKVIQRLEREGYDTIMGGDGMNDAPGLAMARAGVET